MHIQDLCLFCACLSGQTCHKFATQLCLFVFCIWSAVSRARTVHCGNTCIMNQEENNKCSEVVWCLSVFSIITADDSKVKFPRHDLSPFARQFPDILFSIQYKSAKDTTKCCLWKHVHSVCLNVCVDTKEQPWILLHYCLALLHGEMLCPLSLKLPCLLLPQWFPTSTRVTCSHLCTQNVLQVLFTAPKCFQDIIS